MTDRDADNRANQDISPYLLRSPRSLEQAQRQRERQRQSAAAPGEPPADRWTVSPAEVAALIDLGVSDDAIATYLLIDQAQVAALRAYLHDIGGHPGQPADNRATILDRAFHRLSVAELRDQARVLIAEARINPDEATPFAERAFGLAQMAEALERRAADDAASPAGTTSDQDNEDDAAVLHERARRWRMRAEEYRTVAEAIQSPSAREAYVHLAHSYEALAAQFEARAGRLEKKKSGSA